MEVFIFAVLLGLVPATIASHKGRSFGTWWAYGTLLLIVALPMALLMKPKVAVAQEVEPTDSKDKARPDNFVPGWLVLAVFVLLGGLIWFMANDGGSEPATLSAAAQSETVRSQATTLTPAGETNQSGSLTVAQSNAVRSAKQYLTVQGFSRAGLIHQLSSNVGDGYTVADATVAVDSLSIDWNEEAVRSAKQYLTIQGFSCRGLIQQLSSTVGDEYTVSQATYGAQQTGVCQ